MKILIGLFLFVILIESSIINKFMKDLDRLETLYISSLQNCEAKK